MDGMAAWIVCVKVENPMVLMPVPAVCVSP